MRASANGVQCHADAGRAAAVKFKSPPPVAHSQALPPSALPRHDQPAAHPSCPSPRGWLPSHPTPAHPRYPMLCPSPDHLLGHVHQPKAALPGLHALMGSRQDERADPSSPQQLLKAPHQHARMALQGRGEGERGSLSGRSCSCTLPASQPAFQQQRWHLQGGSAQQPRCQPVSQAMPALALPPCAPAAARWPSWR